MEIINAAHLIVRRLYFLSSYKLNAMNAKDILQASLLDLIFENRNKNYGAYTLRKYYPQRLLKAFLLMTAFVMTVVIGLQLMPSKTSLTIRELIIEPTYVLPPVEKVKPLQAKPNRNVQRSQEIKQRQPAANVQLNNAAKNLLADKIEFNATTQSKINSSLLPAALPGSGLPTTGGTGQGDGLEGEAPNGQAGDTATHHAGPVEFAEQMPEFAGGRDALYKFLASNLKSPYELDEGEERLVRVRFVVGLTGDLEDYEVLQSGGRAFDKEVVRVLKKMPAWKPGKSRNKAVAVYFILPVTFRTHNM